MSIYPISRVDHAPEYKSWPIGGIDELLSELQERYLPDIGHVDIPGLLCDPSIGEIAIVSSFGAESVVLLHYINEIRPGIPVLFLDTEKHFYETLQYRDEIVSLLDLNLRAVKPNAETLRADDPDGALCNKNPNACCTLRKTFPLQDAISPFDSWISGRKRYQAKSRAALPIIERDGEKLKVNPMAIWDKQDVNAYFEQHSLPRHPLEAKGYLSVGCEPCTRPVADGENLRAGRWSHAPDKTECGIHLGPEGRFIRSASSDRRGSE